MMAQRRTAWKRLLYHPWTMIALIMTSPRMLRQVNCWNVARMAGQGRRYHRASVSTDSLLCPSLPAAARGYRCGLSFRLRMASTIDTGVDVGAKTSEEEEEEEKKVDLHSLTPGVSNGFFIVKDYPIPETGLDLSGVDDKTVQRLGLTPDNVTLPVALMVLDPIEYPSMSKARKACRNMNVLIHRGPLTQRRDEESKDDDDDDDDYYDDDEEEKMEEDEEGEHEFFDLDRCIRGFVGDRVFPGDVVAKQVRVGEGEYPSSHFKQPFELPVVYEDDHFAIVNKPPGVVVHPTRGHNHGPMSIRACLTFVITPPSPGTMSIMRRPSPVHRLDKPTSGLLLVAKTKPSMVALTAQFVARKIKKTYTAIVNGLPYESATTNVMTSEEAYHQLGVDVDPSGDDRWQLIDHALDEKEAITLWRSIRYANCLKANDETLTLVELKPKTGRYHQLRRHMAWVCEKPLVGDKGYDGGGKAVYLRQRGLFLCSNQLLLEHPYFNTDKGRQEWESLGDAEKYAGGRLYLSESDDKVMVKVSIELPPKFESFLNAEDKRFHKERAEEGKTTE